MIQYNNLIQSSNWKKEDYLIHNSINYTIFVKPSYKYGGIFPSITHNQISISTHHCLQPEQQYPYSLHPHHHISMICKYTTPQPTTLSLRKAIDNNHFDFQFPYSSFKTQRFKQPNQINQHLLRQGIKHYFLKGRVFNRDDQTTKDSIKVIFTCKTHKCPARLVYCRYKYQPYMSIIQFDNLHRHKKHNHPQKARRQEINQFILHLRGEEYEQYRRVAKWVQKFDIANAEALYITEQVYWYNNTEDWILSALAHEGNTIRRVVRRKKSKMDGNGNGNGKIQGRISQIEQCRYGYKQQQRHSPPTGPQHYHYSQQQQTLLILITTPTMKESYQLYGQALTVQVYHETIKQRKPIGQSHAIGYILGQDNNMQVVLFAIFVIVEETKHIYKAMLQMFFHSMPTYQPQSKTDPGRNETRGKQFKKLSPSPSPSPSASPSPPSSYMPLCIITAQIPELTQAIAQLQLQHNHTYAHLHPWYHMTRTLKHKLKQSQIWPQYGKHIMQVLCLALQQKSQKQYYGLMCQAKTMLSSKQQSHLSTHPEIFQQFASSQHKYCSRRLPPKFSGFGISTKFGQKVLRQVENPCVYKVHTGRLLHKLLKIEKHLLKAAQKIRYVNNQLIKYCPQEINCLYAHVEANVMEIVVETYARSSLWEVVFVDAVTARVAKAQERKEQQHRQRGKCEGKQKQELQLQMQLGQQWICRFVLEYDHWECACMELVHTGLPCCHLMRVVLDSRVRGSLWYYINSRWVHAKQDRSRKSMRGQSITNKKRSHNH